jgi:hypothetical protein
MKTLQSVSLGIGILCTVLALSTSTGCPLGLSGEPGQAAPFLPLVAAVGAICGVLTSLRHRHIDQRLRDIVEESGLAEGEREIAHRDAASDRKSAAVMFLAAPIGLGLWLAYLFKGETLGAAELLLLAPLVGFGAGMVGGLWRTRQEKN